MCKIDAIMCIFDTLKLTSLPLDRNLIFIIFHLFFRKNCYLIYTICKTDFYKQL